MKWEFATIGRHYRRALVAVAIALGVNATAVSAFAQVSTTPYQSYVFNQSCSVPCTLNFAQVPLNHRLEVSNVSCLIRWDAVANPMYIDNIQLLVMHTTIESASTLAPIPTHTLDPQVPHSRLTFSANHQVSVFAAAQRNFRVVADTTGGAAANFFACHISGQMVKLS